MIKILVDADLVLEMLMNREGFIEDISDLLDRVNPLIQNVYHRYWLAKNIYLRQVLTK